MSSALVPRDATIARLQVADVDVDLAGRPILRDVSLTVMSGEIVGLIGPNGSGKSTLLNVISGYYQPLNGSVVVDGIDITDASSTARAHDVGRSFQSMSGTEQLTLQEYVQIGADIRTSSAGRTARSCLPRPSIERQSRHIAAELLDDAGLSALRNRSIGSCPYGVRKVTDVLRVFAGTPKIVLLDEPTSGVGRASSSRVMDLCRGYVERHGGSVLMVDHDMQFITDCCSSVVALAAGEVLANGAPGDVLNRPAVVETLLGSGPR